MSVDREILVIKRNLILDNIAFTSSRMVKDIDSPDVRGMTEVPTSFIKQLDKHLHDLDLINNQIIDFDLKK